MCFNSWSLSPGKAASISATVLILRNLRGGFAFVDSKRCSPGMNLARDFDGEVERALGAFAAHDRGCLVAHAADERLQFEFQRFVLLDWNGLADNFLAAEFADDCRIARVQQLFQE